jgi:ergothioneine biosynthesis protein EgtB
MLANLAARYTATRRLSEYLCKPLAVEDFVVQSMPDASPTRWHLAHTTWFFETFPLARWEPGFRSYSSDYQVLFNSYYNGVGEQFPRARRGLLSRPTVAEVFEYRKNVDERMTRLMRDFGGGDADEFARIVELGIHHEQQHQELLLTDIKHMFSCNPLRPVYRAAAAKNETDIQSAVSAGDSKSNRWSGFPSGVVQIGHDKPTFAFDNERPRHSVFLQPFKIHPRLVTAGEFLEFIEAGGYRRPEFWLSLGWSTVREQKWTAPLYWSQKDGKWSQFTLSGFRAVDVDEPVTHVSFFEADAFARWSGARLPTEAEWEQAASSAAVQGSFVESEHYHPAPAGDLPGGCHEGIAQLFGEVWQWTASPYTPYPGYIAPPGALGEYNGKFMCNQYVLRGGSCATPASHIRPTYRNFFPPDARWQFSGIRLAHDGQSDGGTAS